jgi:hypothetical protein
MGTLSLSSNMKPFSININNKEVAKVIPDDNRISINHNAFYTDTCSSLHDDLEDLKKQIAALTELSVRDPNPRRRIKSITMRF